MNETILYKRKDLKMPKSKVSDEIKIEQIKLEQIKEEGSFVSSTWKWICGTIVGIAVITIGVAIAISNLPSEGG